MSMQIRPSLTHDELQHRLQVALREGTPNIAQTLVGLNVRTSYTHAGRFSGWFILVVAVEMLQMYHFLLIFWSLQSFGSFTSHLFYFLYVTAHCTLDCCQKCTHHHAWSLKKSKLIACILVFFKTIGCELFWFLVCLFPRQYSKSPLVWRNFLNFSSSAHYSSHSLSPLVLRHRNAWSHTCTFPAENRNSSTRPAHVSPLPTTPHSHLPCGRCPNHSWNSGQNPATRPFYVSMWDISENVVFGNGSLKLIFVLARCLVQNLLVEFVPC